jgi:hypothetical protein
LVGDTESILEQQDCFRIASDPAAVNGQKDFPFRIWLTVSEVE